MMKTHMMQITSLIKSSDPSYETYLASIHKQYFECAFSHGYELGKKFAPPPPECEFCHKRRESNRLAAKAQRERNRVAQDVEDDERLQKDLEFARTQPGGAKGFLMRRAMGGGAM